MRNKNCHFIVIFMVLVQGYVFGQPDQKDASITDSLTYALKKIHSQGYINGFGVAIVNKEGVLYEKGFGYADVQNAESYTQHTLQNIGSVSKTLIGIALLKAQEMNLLKLDDPVNDYLPFKVYNPTYPKEDITLRHLATHTSTILDTHHYDERAYVLKDAIEVSDSLVELSEKFNPPTANRSMEIFLEKVLSENGEWYEKSGFLKRKPGELYEYSNIGATLAALALESATGTSYNKFTSEHILTPLQMTASGWSFDHIDLSKHSTLYATPEIALPLYSLITYPDGGLITSVSDLAKYLHELIKGSQGHGILLHKKSYEEYFTEQLSSDNLPDRNKENDFDDEYNSGIFMGFTPKGYIGHTGGDPGVAAFMFFNPKTNIGRILMINTTVRNSEGVDQFLSIWNTLGVFESRL